MAEINQAKMDVPEVEEIVDEYSKREKKFAIVGVVTGCVLGCVIGYRYCDYRIAKGLDKMFEYDPTFKEHMVNTLCDAWKAKIINN